MAALEDVARKTGQAAALSAVAAGFFLSAAALLTLAAYFLLAPVYGAGQALLILGLVHLAIALIACGAIVVIGRSRAGQSRAPQIEDHPTLGLMAAFLSGVSEGVAAGKSNGETGSR